MRLPDCAVGVLVWAYPGAQEVPCLRRPDAQVMLCGRFLHPDGLTGFTPVLLQPVDPEPACRNCARVLKELLGWCRVCDIELVGDDQGQAPAHGSCVGVNMPLRKAKR